MAIQGEALQGGVLHDFCCGKKSMSWDGDRTRIGSLPLGIEIWVTYDRTKGPGVIILGGLGSHGF